MVMVGQLQLQKSYVAPYQPDTDYMGIITALIGADYDRVVERHGLPRTRITAYLPTTPTRRLLFPLWKHMERQAREQIPGIELKSKQGQHLIIQRPEHLPKYVKAKKSVAMRKPV